MILHWIVSIVLLYLGSYAVAKEFDEMINYEDDNTNRLAFALLIQFISKCVFIMVIILTIVENYKPS